MLSLSMIYAIKAHLNGRPFVKFGRSRDVVRRLSALQVSSPYKLRLLGVGDWPDIEEARIHAYLWAYKARGEWFRESSATDHVVALLVNPDGLVTWHQMIFSPTNQIPKRLAKVLDFKQ